MSFVKKYPSIVVVDGFAIINLVLKWGADEKLQQFLFFTGLILLNIVALIDTIWGWEKYERVLQFLVKIVSVLVLISFLVLLFL